MIQKALKGAKAWARHPAVLMWEGREDALELYMGCLADEMWRRGMRVPRWAPAHPFGVCYMPVWFGHPAVHESHQRNLIRKNHAHYKPLFPQEVDGSDVYAWPTKQDDGVWIIRFKKVGAKSYEDRTEPILPQGANRAGDLFREL